MPQVFWAGGSKCFFFRLECRFKSFFFFDVISSHSYVSWKSFLISWHVGISLFFMTQVLVASVPLLKSLINEPVQCVNGRWKSRTASSLQFFYFQSRVPLQVIVTSVVIFFHVIALLGISI
jgi:hypothetical protein